MLQVYSHQVLPRIGLLTPERIKLMKSWEHSGFNVNASMNKIRYDPAATTVICRDAGRLPATRQSSRDSGNHDNGRARGRLV